MASNILTRRDSTVAKRKKVKTAIIRYGTPLLCIVLILTVGFMIGRNPSVASPTTSSSSYASSPSLSNGSIWIPELPKFDTETVHGTTSNESNSSVDTQSLNPWFDNFEDFERWLISGELGKNIEKEEKQKYKSDYLKKWVYMWQNADMNLQTGYYFKPQLVNNNLKLDYLDVHAGEEGYQLFYRYNVKHSIFNHFADAYSFTLWVNDSKYASKSFEEELQSAKEPEYTGSYEIISHNNIQYHVFIHASGNEKCNYVGIYWKQEDHWYFGYYLASKRDNTGHQEVVKNLNMVKTPFREDVK